MSAVGIFNCGNCAENSSATSDYGLEGNQEVQINGNTNLSTCIKGNNGTKVYAINSGGSPGYYDFVLNVDAQGLEGFFRR